jgi:hypothetical protein
MKVDTTVQYINHTEGNIELISTHQYRIYVFVFLFQFRKSNTLSVIIFKDIELVMFTTIQIFPQMKILITLK